LAENLFVADTSITAPGFERLDLKTASIEALQPLHPGYQPFLERYTLQNPAHPYKDRASLQYALNQQR